MPRTPAQQAEQPIVSLARWRERAQTTGRRSRLGPMPRLIKLCWLALGSMIALALLAPVIAPHDPAYQDLLARLQGPSMAGDHLLGTDHLGRDMLSRVVYGARVSLGIGALGMVIGAVIGSTIGIVAGFRRGIVEDAAMFLVDAQLALPFVVVALIAIAIFGASLAVLIVIVGLAGWETYARLARAMVLGARENPYVLAARAAGATRTRIMVRHILPNISAPLIVLATFQLTAIILLESSLSFLGLGVQPPTPSWGSMIGEGREYLNTAWWIAVVPGVAIMVTTMTISLIGDWLRDELDPRLR